MDAYWLPSGVSGVGVTLQVLSMTANTEGNVQMDLWDNAPDFYSYSIFTEPTLAKMMKHDNRS